MFSRRIVGSSAIAFMPALPPTGRNRMVLIEGAGGQAAMAKILLAEDDDSLRGSWSAH
jgi:hypothetical protein